MISVIIFLYGKESAHFSFSHEGKESAHEIQTRELSRSWVVVHFLSSVSFVMIWTVKEVSSVLFMSFRKLNQVRDFLPMEKLTSSQ